HQVRVVPVVAAEICKVVREAEAARKQLPVTREATPERMTPGVNDGGVREQKVDETDVTEITEHLVHEAGQAPRTVHLSTRQVACGQRFNLLAVECYQRFRIGRPRRWQRTRHRLESPSGDLRQLPCSLHLGMTREHLLQQRGAGPRQSDDEDGITAAASPVCTVREETRGIERLRTPHVRGCGCGVM